MPATAPDGLAVLPRLALRDGPLPPSERGELRCTMAQFEALEDAEETQFLPGAPGQWGYGQNQMLLSPFFRLGMGMGMGMGGMGMACAA